MNKEEIKSCMIDLDMNGMKYHINKGKWNKLDEINKKLIKDFDFGDEIIYREGLLPSSRLKERVNLS